MTVTAEQIRKVLAEAELLYSAAEVETAFDRLAEQVTAAVNSRDPIILCVMTGGLVPAGHLVTRLDFPLQLDYLHATRYRGETSGGHLHWITRPSCALKDRTVVVVDDILDEGLTLAAILDYCRAEGAREVLSVVLVDKRHERRASHINADFAGLEVGDRYVFGFGMDYKGYLRNAAGIYAVRGL
ncbi:MAG TPA: hypoxanthine-guanine phosphoribosyltransferase [Gammaproteobacteria bacterium]|nr:hypoxanthine-guanine phosphoribosyltransferase [Gammaproteobacteria bacterium]